MASDEWDDLDSFAADLVRETILGENVEKLAQVIDKSPDLLYKAANASAVQQLNLKQFLALLKKTKNHRAVEHQAMAFGLEVHPRGTGAELEKLRKIKEVLEK